MSATTNPLTLIVPIDVRALCVGRTDVDDSTESSYGTKDFARIADDFSALPYLDKRGRRINEKANIGEAVLPTPFATASDLLTEGVHLHWALPDALAHGTSDEQGNVAFRAAPNRWLVARIASNTADPAAPAVAVRAWIVESDRLWDKEDEEEREQYPLPQNIESRATPIAPTPDQVGNKAYRAVGAVFPYETWSERPGGVYSEKHTALGYGTPTYAAAYSHCRNVFGFHDFLDDLDLAAFPPASSAISYLVAGWYSDARLDPLASIAATAGADRAGQLAAIEAAYRWTFAAPDDASLPALTLCGGLLCAITWDPANRRYIAPRPDTPLEVAVGNTTAQALAAWLAARPDLAGLDHVERTLDALQLNLLQRLGPPGGLARVEEALHQKDFGSTFAGRTWLIKRRNAGNVPEGQPVAVTDDDLLAAAGGTEQPLPADLAAALNELNALQWQCDRTGFEIDSRRSQVFADWYKYMSLEYPGPLRPTGGPTPDDARHFIGEAIRALDARVGDLQQQTADREAKLGEVQGKLGDTYLLQDVPSPRFWHANDPVLLLVGQDAQPARRYGGDGRYDPRGNLLCRPARALVAALTVEAGGVTIAAGDLPLLPASPNQSFPAELAALLGEGFFLDPRQSPVLAHAAAARGGANNPAVADPGGLAGTIATAQRAFLAGSATTGVAFAGQSPSPVGVGGWAPPWFPIMMQWEAYYYPLQAVGGGTGANYGADFITTNFHLDDDNIDLACRQPVPAHLSNLQIYQGTAVLTGGAGINLQAQIDAYRATYPDDDRDGELQTIRDSLAGGDLPMLAQALGGFHQALLTRRQTLQLPVSDPIAETRILARFSNTTVSAAVGKLNDTAPMPHDAYSPLRAGWLKFNRIWLIDAFGQVRAIAEPPVVRAAGLIPPGDRPGEPLLGLPPRLAQPSRLLFRWLSADDDQVEMNSDPASSPICGWVLFNHLDDSLMIYDAAGVALGSLNGQGQLWQGAPGDGATFGQPIEAVFAGANPHLRDFALGVARNPDAAGFLADFLATIDRTATNVVPLGHKQSSGLSVLIGRPLALVRASLNLELQGLPALDQGWAAFNAAVTANTIDGRAAGFPAVQFPVRLGDLGQIDDGLIGYFVDDGSASAYRRFYAAASQSAANGVVSPAPDQLLLATDPAAPPVVLTLLVDPQAPVHATTGILPVKQIAIPPAMYAPALGHMAVTFLAAPVLSGAARFALPVPREHGYAWSWVERDPGDGGWTVLDQIATATPQATMAYPPQRIGEGWLKLYPAALPATDKPS